MKKFLCLILFLVCSVAAFGQGQKRVVQVSGLVVSGEQAQGVPGVAFFVPKAGRGVTSNQYGYFSLATLAGDSALISGLGFKKQYYLVPDDGRQSISVIIYLQEDTLMYPVVEVFPYPTEELFKQAFLDLKLPEAEMDRMRRNLEPELLAQLRIDAGMGAQGNYRYFVNQQAYTQANRQMAPTVQLLNPFAWKRFIESVKRGDLKSKRKNKYDTD
jgi:hypothetical protein